MKISNKDVIQSYIFTVSKYNFSVYEKRIFYRLVEIAQADLEGKKLKQGYSINKTLFDDRIIKIPVKAFLKDEEDKNHAQIKKALTNLRNKTIEYEDNKVWQLIGIIEKPKYKKYDEIAEFEINPMVWHAVLNFSKGFRKYELETAMSFESIYSMRFYELFSGVKSPITYSITELKIMFQIENKYKNRPADFIKNVITYAQQELNKKAPYSFIFETLKIGRRITAIKFYPVYIAKNRDGNLEKKALQKQISLSWDLDKIIVDYLKQNFLFTTKEIQNNIELFKKANNKIDLLLELSKLKEVVREKKNAKAYVIGTLKQKIK